jgi:hypothetical protein
VTSRAAVLLALLLAACGPLTSRFPGNERYTLVIRQFPERYELARLSLPVDHRFSLSFIHSVSGTPVRDDYVVEEGEIIQVAETFETHVAGLPALADEPDLQRWEFKEGRFVIHLRRPIVHLVMRTDRRYRNRLLLATREIDLNQWEDQALELGIEPPVRYAR